MMNWIRMKLRVTCPKGPMSHPHLLRRGQVFHPDLIGELGKNVGAPEGSRNRGGLGGTGARGQGDMRVGHGQPEGWVITPPTGSRKENLGPGVQFETIPGAGIVLVTADKAGGDA